MAASIINAIGVGAPPLIYKSTPIITKNTTVGNCQSSALPNNKFASSASNPLLNTEKSRTDENSLDKSLSGESQSKYVPKNIQIHPVQSGAGKSSSVDDATGSETQTWGNKDAPATTAVVDLGRFLFPMSPVLAATVNKVSNVPAHNLEFPRDAGVISVGSIPLLKDPVLTTNVQNPEIDGSNQISQRSSSPFATVLASGANPVVAGSTLAQNTPMVPVANSSLAASSQVNGVPNKVSSGGFSSDTGSPVDSTAGEIDPVSLKNGSQNPPAGNTHLTPEMLAQFPESVWNQAAVIVAEILKHSPSGGPLQQGIAPASPSVQGYQTPLGQAPVPVAGNRVSFADAVKGGKNSTAAGVGQSPENPISVEGKDSDSPLGQAVFSGSIPNAVFSKEDGDQVSTVFKFAIIVLAQLDLDWLLHTQLEASSSMQILHTQFRNNAQGNQSTQG
ncbi:hypothetical protein OROMI_010449 [Orobanche minor]